MLDTLIDRWLDLPILALFVTLIFCQGGFALLLWLLVHKLPCRARIQSLNGVVAPFFNSVAILFALLTGFLANDISNRNHEARRAVAMEAGALRAIHSLGLASHTDSAAISTAIRTYIKAVVGDEWHKMNEEKVSPEADAAFQAVLQTVSDPEISRSASSAVHGALLQNIAVAQRARLDRLDVSGDRSAPLKWLIVLLLSAMTQVAISLVHLEKARAHAAALVIFTTASVFTLGVVALQENPFSGPLRILPVPFSELLAVIPSN